MGGIYGSYIQLTSDIKKRLKSNREAVVVIDGNRGEGKSTLAILMAQACNKEHFDIAKDIIYIPNDTNIKEAINSKPREKVIVIDEAIRAFYKMDFMNSIQNSLMKFFNTHLRKENKCVICCLPAFTSLRREFRDDIVLFRIFVPLRGKAFVFYASQNPMGGDKWGLDVGSKAWLEEFKNKNMLDIEINKKYEFLRNLPQYVGEFTFPKLDPETEKEYLHLVEKSKESIEAMEQDNSVGKLKEISAKLKLEGWTQEKRAALVGKDRTTISLWDNKKA
jgi:energy-coupling factor transporter ATP-binding protein EcfA2